MRSIFVKYFTRNQLITQICSNMFILEFSMEMPWQYFNVGMWWFGFPLKICPGCGDLPQVIDEYHISKSDKINWLRSCVSVEEEMLPLKMASDMTLNKSFRWESMWSFRFHIQINKMQNNWECLNFEPAPPPSHKEKTLLFYHQPCKSVSHFDMIQCCFDTAKAIGVRCSCTDRTIECLLCPSGKSERNTLSKCFAAITIVFSLFVESNNALTTIKTR